MTSLLADLKVTPSPSDDIQKEVPSERYLIDDIEAATKCKLVLSITVGSDNIIEVSTGLTFPCGREQMIQTPATAWLR